MSFLEDIHSPPEPPESPEQQEPAMTIDEAISAANHAQIERDQTSYGYEVAVALLYSRTLTKQWAKKAYQQALANLAVAMKGA